ncbi:MAG TPA: ester cyclase [Acidobacteriaceae bacterium]|nr:ester cyclase [Acidobacteriaceae bacterium]
MSEANKLLVRRWFEQVWNQKSEAAIDQMFSKQGKSHGFPDGNSVLEGPEAFKAVHRTFCGAFPDIHVDLEDILAEEDHVAARWRASMTHTGDQLGFPATGKKEVMHGSSFVIVSGNQIVEGWNHMDFQALMNRLQATSPAGTTESSPG